MSLGRKAGSNSKAATAPTRGFFARHWRSLLITTGCVVVTGAVAAAAIWGENSPFYGQAQLAFDDLGNEVARATGLTVNEILVVGRDATPRQALVDAVGVEFGDAILGVDLQQVRERVMTLPWVSTAAIERVLPDTLVVHLTERKPVALWQRQKQYTVIDRDGHELDTNTAAAYPDLLVVTGEDAPKHAAALVDMLRSEPELMERVDSAMWVGGRRWNVFLENGVSVRLPEEQPEEAWHRLGEYQRVHALLSKNVRSIDMRFPEKLILRPGAPQVETPEDPTAGSSGAATGSPPAAGSAPRTKAPAAKTPKAKVTQGKATQGKVTDGTAKQQGTRSAERNDRA